MAVFSLLHATLLCCHFISLQSALVLLDSAWEPAGGGTEKAGKTRQIGHESHPLNPRLMMKTEGVPFPPPP